MSEESRPVPSFRMLHAIWVRKRKGVFRYSAFLRLGASARSCMSVGLGLWACELSTLVRVRRIVALRCGRLLVFS